MKLFNEKKECNSICISKTFPLLNKKRRFFSGAKPNRAFVGGDDLGDCGRNGGCFLWSRGLGFLFGEYEALA